ncbi:protein RESTRICTED TEV MOVEMENT 3-like [Lycium barbarum]|uniref:protein RESTRICTED TEV MOVEMENT 3-like n=1 Tax=Lycium barbarum TaxID=112863 RepID=UPI00293EF15B|nr:protein RESTRICTED TEV MOVEMENT 3-like [Lycium barbarum]
MADLCNEDGVSRSISETPPTHYTLKIQSLSLLKKNNIEKYTSPYFEAGGYKWKLVFHPNGNKNKNKAGNHVSVYLMMADATSLAPAGWEVHAAFRLYLLDQNNDNYLVLQDTSNEKGRRFHAMKVEWGFDRFMSQEAFSNPENGYVVDDTCVLGAEVYVCQEKFPGRGDCLSMVKDPISFEHTWKINTFSAITANCEDSRTFIAGEHKWKIQVYPKGKGSGTGSHLSLYLTLAEPSSLSQGTQIYADLTLRIPDSKNERYYSDKANYWFSASHTSCGWPRFIPIWLFNYRYQVKGACVIVAEVTVHGITTKNIML